MYINYIQKIEAELVARGQSWSRGGGVGQIGAELVARGRSFFLGSKDFSLEAKFFGNSV
jgi:hypothetical protein